MERIPTVFDLVFGCHHRDLSLVLTLGRAAHRVCGDSGHHVAALAFNHVN